MQIICFDYYSMFFLIHSKEFKEHHTFGSMPLKTKYLPIHIFSSKINKHDNININSTAMHT